MNMQRLGASEAMGDMARGAARVQGVCVVCGGPEAICDESGSRGCTHCKACSKPGPSKCITCGQPVPPVWMGPTKEHPFDPKLIPFRWLPGEPECKACAQKAREAKEAAEAKKQAAQIRAAAGLPPEASGWDFAAAEVGARALLDDGDFQAWWESYQVVRYWNLRNKWPYLLGPARRGKTVLLYCLVHECVAVRQKAGLFLDATHLAGLLAERSLLDNQNLIQRAKTVHFLALDDLGVVPLRHKKQRSGFFEILDYRLKHKLPTAISSNLEYADLDRQIPRDHSRIAGRVVDLTAPVRMTGPNLTMAKAARGL